MKSWIRLLPTQRRRQIHWRENITNLCSGRRCRGHELKKIKKNDAAHMHTYSTILGISLKRCGNERNERTKVLSKAPLLKMCWKYPEKKFHEMQRTSRTQRKAGRWPSGNGRETIKSLKLLKMVTYTMVQKYCGKEERNLAEKLRKWETSTLGREWSKSNK